MKTSYVVLFLLFSHVALGQLQENFDDGNFNSSPVWLGDTAFFKVNSSGELQSKGPASNAILQLSTAREQILNTEWNFYVRLEFDPSASNYAKVYLTSDRSGLKDSLNGYFIKIGGETGSTDGIDLYKQQGTVASKLIDGISGHSGKSINRIRVKVIRDLTGNWVLLSDTTGGYNFLPEGTAFDNSITASSYFGLVCVQSSTRNELFYFDDFEIKEAPLRVINAYVVNDTCIELSFNKEVEKFSAEDPHHYWINSLENPLSVTYLNSDPFKVRLFLAKPLLYGSNSISVSYVKDLSGFFIDSNSTLFFDYKKSLNYGDLLITEIFPDPSPSNDLPGEEFIEIFNNTSDSLDISGFTFSDASSLSVLPFYKLGPFEYLTLANLSVKNEFEDYGAVLGLSPWPSLNNSTDDLTLKDQEGKVIFKVEYSQEWYGNEQKKEGGWSMEMVNPKEFCAGKMNWKASENPAGGTPGKVNSVFSNLADQSPPELIELAIVDSTHICLKFNESLDTTIQSSDFRIDQNISITKTEVINSQAVILTLHPALKIRDTYYLSLENVKDCKGNKFLPEKVMEVLLPEVPDSLDIVINEILFNPFMNGVDFVEIYNKSSKSVNLKNWQLGNMKNDTLSDRQKIFMSSYILHPHQYLCLSAEPSVLATHYFLPFPERCIKMPRFPSYNDDIGSVLLIGSSGEIIDQFNYREDFHFPMIDHKEGISLERISFFAPTNNAHNWHSAAETAGWATPGYENSQHKEAEFPKAVSVDPKVFTPDQDAWKDFAFINYQFKEPGYVANITIYDVKGRAVKILARNQLLGREGFFQWDGTNEEGRVANTGYYIVFFEAFNLKGDVSGYKQTVVLARKF